ncbi:hypothetical protein ACFXHA_10545 [Nocardia sp. NPDC059240]|uniref:hypothetical protein n=1 Tax=Nocardia sp. NPDC059240 TaxID=3346786 RepID=UPI0036AC4574
MNSRSAFVGVAIAAAAVSLTGTGTAGADTNDYLIGDTVYFNSGPAQCSIRPNGDVGCDIASGIATWLGVIPVTDLVIDVSFLPAHPTFGAFGPHGRADARTLDQGPNGYGSTVSYAGATCSGGGRGGTSCQAKGHSFSFGWSGTQTS